jgi:hypothetical protein
MPWIDIEHDHAGFCTGTESNIQWLASAPPLLDKSYICGGFAQPSFYVPTVWMFGGALAVLFAAAALQPTITLNRVMYRENISTSADKSAYTIQQRGHVGVRAI